MICLMNGRISAAYPLEVNEDIPLPLPWWGDLLPHLIHETNSTLEAVQEKAADYIDCPPAMVEGMIAGLMAKGQRNIDGLWEMLRLTFNTTNFRTFDPDELPEHIEQFFYDEWDKCLSAYKKDWCVVHQQPSGVDPNPFVYNARIRLHGLISTVRRQFMRFKPEKFKKYRAQSSGDELDIDALIQAVVDKRAGSFLDENVYLRRDKMVRDVSVLFLVDTSDSTDEKVNGRRVIDIQKEAVVLMSEALESLEDTYALFGFNSESRFKVNMFTIKDFDEPNNEFVKYRLGNLEPRGLTRLGAAIRHAASRLSVLPSRVKLLVILTDGRPYDIDYGDLDYAIADTKKAIHEARRKKIHPFIITSDKEGANYLSKISPITQSIVLPRIELLPAMLPAIYKRLTI
jgi:nitric oxide reductase activation protein